MKKFIVLIFAFISITTYSQEAGINVYAGPSMAVSTDEIVTAKGQAHFGYVIGAHARLNSDNMYFLLSGEYGTFDFLSNSKYNFIGGEDLSYIKGKVGLGFDVKRITRSIVLRTKLQGSFMFLQDYPTKELATNGYYWAKGYKQINDGIGGLATCIGVRIGSITVDLEYEHGLFNLFYEKEKSKINFFNLVGGFKF